MFNFPKVSALMMQLKKSPDFVLADGSCSEDVTEKCLDFVFDLLWSVLQGCSCVWILCLTC